MALPGASGAPLVLGAGQVDAAVQLVGAGAAGGVRVVDDRLVGHEEPDHESGCPPEIPMLASQVDSLGAGRGDAARREALRRHYRADADKAVHAFCMTTAAAPNRKIIHVAGARQIHEGGRICPVRSRTSW